jgi:hypothetical protein
MRGLTRVSIDLRRSLAKTMDCRVKPGNDESERQGRAHVPDAVQRPSLCAAEPGPTSPHKRSAPDQQRTASALRSIRGT